MVFGSRLKGLRKKRGFTQEGLVKASGVHWRTIGRLENEPEAVVTAQTFQAICGALGGWNLPTL